MSPPIVSFPQEAFTSWQRTETRQLETSNRSPAFLPNVLSNRQKWRYRTTTDKKKPKKYKTRETCQLQSSSRAVLHISKCTVKTISLSMPKINLQTQHRHPQNTFTAILLQFWLRSSDIFCKSFQLLICELCSLWHQVLEGRNMRLQEMKVLSPFIKQQRHNGPES